MCILSYKNTKMYIILHCKSFFYWSHCFIMFSNEFVIKRLSWSQCNMFKFDILFSIFEIFHKKKYNYGLSINASKTHASLKSKERVENPIYPKGACFMVVKSYMQWLKFALRRIQLNRTLCLCIAWSSEGKVISS